MVVKQGPPAEVAALLAAQQELHLGLQPAAAGAPRKEDARPRCEAVAMWARRAQPTVRLLHLQLSGLKPRDRLLDRVLEALLSLSPRAVRACSRVHVHCCCSRFPAQGTESKLPCYATAHADCSHPHAWCRYFDTANFILLSVSGPGASGHCL